MSVCIYLVLWVLECLIVSVSFPWGCVCVYHIVFDYVCLFVSPYESRGYLGFSTVTPPPQRFPDFTGGLLEVRFWPFFHFLAQFSYTESQIILWLVYIIHIYVLCKHAEI